MKESSFECPFLSENIQHPQNNLCIVHLYQPEKEKL
jgi:hypothetical protein